MTKRRSGDLAIIPAAAVFDRRLRNADVRILAALGSFADRDGRCWPAESTLADGTGISERHIRDRLHVLEDVGYVQIERRPGLSNIYRLPRNYSAGVLGGDPGTPVPHPRNHSAGDPGTTVPPNDIKNDTNNEHTVGVSSNHTEFETFWQSYPSRRPHSNPKKPALAKFEAAVKNGTPPADIIRGAQNYTAYVRRERIDPKYVAQAQTWLSQERWTEYQSVMPPSEAAYDSDVIH